MRTTPKVERLLDQPEAAALYGLHVSTLIRARRSGDLRAVKFGRRVKYRESDLASWAESNLECD
ncbi:helix-turn-helix domain-containing protein [Nocardioides caricicola]|uniref:Helix-turn-helix domain-containing protein n=1 Tax=Nocardioides caricicola TaxID=634770 RepID=A0ABW0N3C5_9ACTN